MREYAEVSPWDYVRRVVREGMRPAGTVDLVLGAILGAALLILTTSGFVSPADGRVLGLALALIFVGTLMFIFLMYTPWRVYKSTAEELDELRRAATATIELVEPVLYNKTWLVRLSITSATAHRFCAQVFKTKNLELPEPPWWIPWRHDRNRATRLYPNVPEMLKVGDMVGARIRCHVLEYEGENEGLHDAIIHEPGAQLLIIVWDAETGHLAGQKWLHLPHVSDHSGEAPKVRLSDVEQQSASSS